MKNKKTIIALSLLMFVGVVGLTIAYFSNSLRVKNEFDTSKYGAMVDEEFESPDNWTPGTTTPKTLVVTNTGEVDEAVRVSYTESWVSKNGEILPLSQNGNIVSLINWTNEEDWETVEINGKIYKYLTYKLAPGEVTPTLLESVTFNKDIINNENCQTINSNETTTIACNSTGNSYDEATYKLTFRVETVQYNKYVETWGTNVAILEEKPAPVVELTGAEYLASSATNEANAEYNDDTKGKMFQFTHTVNNQTVNESRYIGNDPNNYVYFNCTDDTDTDICEVWRILGTFEVERTDPTDSTKTITETRMKLVRGNSIKNDYWNTAYNGSGRNDWTADNATLKLFLNGEYYNNIGTALTEGYGLQESARNMIEDAKYYLGAFVRDSSLTTEQLYDNERGNTMCGSCGTDTQKLTWIGKVGLMYPSDMYMTYKGVKDACYNTPANSSKCNSTNASTGWLYNSNKLSTDANPYHTWFLSPYSSFTSSVFSALSTGYLSSSGAVDASYGVRPVVYLKSDIKIDGGNGESTNPYKLGL